MNATPDKTDSHDCSNWCKPARRRRCVLLFLIAAPAICASMVVHSLLPATSGPIMNMAVALLFALLFAWVAIGFWSALAGLAIMLRRFDRFSVVAGTGEDHSLPERARAALLFPVYNEDSGTVIEEIRTVWQSLKALGVQRNFDIFMLSDSTSPDAWAREEECWHRLCREEHAEESIFYRHRKINRKGKSGNVADFCRRWGVKYPYMIVFDADSLMSGETIVRLVQAMEKHPEVGIIQTAPKSINSHSLIARMQQFSNHLYGPAFAAGLNYWQLGDAQYWGHNAIIRIEPFMRFCHLPTLPGHAPLGGNILSHDFVEAALMRRAGYGVWLAYELDGSYEENPPTLIDELIRDRRWCQGNLQHSRLLFTRGFFPTHRALFINGIMSYGSALLWFFFLLASSFQAILELIKVPVYFPDGYSLYPDWPKFFSQRSLALLGATAVILFLPKIFTLLLVALRGEAGRFGGVFGMGASAFLEIVVSALLAPVRMVFHSFFVVTTLLGFTVRWNNQNREGGGTGWWQAVRFHWWGMLGGTVWGLAMLLVNPGFFFWLSPIVAGLMLSVPLSVLTSRPGLGAAAARLGLFRTPPDIEPPAIVTAFQENMKRVPLSSPFLIPESEGFVRTVTMPKLFALHMALLRKAHVCTSEKEAELSRLVERALLVGPAALGVRERRVILSEPHCLAELHRRVWLLDNLQAKEWGIR